MALPIENFVIPESKENGLSQIANSYQQRYYRMQNLQLRQNAQKTSASRYLTNELNNYKFTGTDYDPIITKGISDAMTQGMELAHQGADVPTIQMTIAPLLENLNQYKAKAMMYNQNKKLAIDFYKKQGYNTDRIGQLMDDYTFHKTDDKGNKTLDVENADPTGQNALQLINQNNLHEITDGKMIQDWVKNSSKDVTENNAQVDSMDKFGNRYVHKLRVKAPTWVQPDTDANGNVTFVPKHDIAADNGLHITHNGQPVRLLDNNTFYSFMDNTKNRDFVLGQVQQALKSGDFKDEDGQPITINSPKAEMLAKAIAYDELKPYAGGLSQVMSKNTIPLFRAKINSGVPLWNPNSNPQNVPINDIHATLKSHVDAAGKTSIRDYDLSTQDYLLDAANKRSKGLKITADDVYTDKDVNGEPALFFKPEVAEKLKTHQFIGSVTQQTNVKAQTNSKAKIKAQQEANQTQPTTQEKKKISW